jgi:hypothetical protein
MGYAALWSVSRVLLLGYAGMPETCVSRVDLKVAYGTSPRLFSKVILLDRTALRSRHFNYSDSFHCLSAPLFTYQSHRFLLVKSIAPKPRPFLAQS